MITNRQILDIITKKEEYEKQLLNLDVAKAVCEYLKDAAAIDKIRKDYNQIMQEYEQWLDSEAQ